MKKYISLSIIGFFGLGLLFYSYVHSESSLAQNHQNVLKLFITIRHVENSLEKDLLKSRNYLLLSYDPIVIGETEVGQICSNLHNSDYSIYKTIDVRLDNAIDGYCSEIELKLSNIERFKSKNSVLRNSVFYLQKLTTEAVKAEQTAIFSPSSEIRSKLIKASLAYALVSTDTSKEALSSVLEQVKFLQQKDHLVDDLDTISLHAAKVFEIKEDLDNTIKKIVNSNSSQLLEQIRENYFQGYSRAEKAATSYRRVLFGICSFFLILIIFGVVKLLNAAHALTHANETLESRVEERTRELKKSQETIVQQQQFLITSAKMSALGEMAGGVAHEINTPLAIITMRAEQMEECINDGDIEGIDFKDGLNVIKNTSEKIAKIVSGLRFFAREGRKDLPQKTKISTLIEDTLSFCLERFSNYGVQFEILKDNSYEKLEVECRSVEVSQVLLNLLNNAFDAIQSLKDKWVRIGVVDLGQYVEISVIDSGSGIPKDLHDKIMQPFFTTKDIGKGTGLGLSISKGIIDEHQGKLYLDPDSSNTRFVVLIPKVQNTTEIKKAA